MEFYQGPDRTQGRVPEAEFKDYVYWKPRFFLRGFLGSLKFSVVPTIFKLCGFFLTGIAFFESLKKFLWCLQSLLLTLKIPSGLQ